MTRLAAPVTRIGGWDGATALAFGATLSAAVTGARIVAPGVAWEFADFASDPGWLPLALAAPYLILGAGLWCGARSRRRARSAVLVLLLAVALDLVPLLLRGLDPTLSLVVFLLGRVFLAGIVVWAWGLARRRGPSWGWGVPLAFLITLVVDLGLLRGLFNPVLGVNQDHGLLVAFVLPELIPSVAGILLGVATDRRCRRTPPG